MRLSLFAVALCAAAPLPALAQQADEPALAGAIEAMNDPATQEQVSLMAGMLVGVLMEMPVGQLAQTAAEMSGENAAPIDPDARVKDLLGEHSVDASRRVSARVPQMMEAMSGMAGALETMLPALRGMAERFEREMPRVE